MQGTQRQGVYMKKNLAISALFLGMSTLCFSTSALSEEVVITDPITGVVEGTATIVSGTVNTAVGVVPGVGNGYIMHSNMGYGMPGTVVMRPGIQNNDQYLIQGVGKKTTITDLKTGKSYWVKGVKSGTMDVNDGNGVTRYQYNTYIVKRQ
jgi:hypothetical protein